MAAVAEVKEYAVVHDERGIHVRVAVRSGASPEGAATEARRALREKQRALAILMPEIDVRVVDAIEREGGHAAKVKLIRSESTQ